ncbi:hypothetical protein PoB_006012400 [Plakobranchus ocellatus]|uniref:Uncharacterized protein n=1 Tax=Plakobranchus ocellatus TaxID=259542 RepID=A0AAV4CP29_9GAST|nr:hypothetical protein PoB_006012400 [Plakobranchus ocellatus]
MTRDMRLGQSKPKMTRETPVGQPEADTTRNIPNEEHKPNTFKKSRSETSVPFGQGIGGESRTRDRRIPADLMADSLPSLPPTLLAWTSRALKGRVEALCASPFLSVVIATGH